MVGLSRKRVFPKTKGDSITGQDRAQKHCNFRFSQIEKKSKVAVLQLQPDWLILRILHQSFEIERPKGHWSEVVVHLYISLIRLYTPPDKSA